MYELAIIGGGPAGVAAGVYAARKRLKTVFIAEMIGGQSTDSQDIQNWIGTPHIAGMALAKALEGHLREYADGPGEQDVDLKLGERASKVEKTGTGFTITTPKGSYEAKTVLVSTGGSRRKLDAAGADQFENKGLTYCASCDGPLFSGQDVAVIGGGNAGFESASQLLAYCKSVTLVHRSPEFLRADKATVDAVLAHPNMRTITNATPVEVRGDMFVKSLTVKDNATGALTELPVAGIFVEIGMIAATELVKDLVALNEAGKIVVDAKTQRASVPGIWAAGDCTDGLYHQNNIAAGDAVKALEDIYYFIKAGGTTPKLESAAAALETQSA
jgi:NADH-dependent peroxiredoxin subunit F